MKVADVVGWAVMLSLVGCGTEDEAEPAREPTGEGPRDPSVPVPAPTPGSAAEAAEAAEAEQVEEGWSIRITGPSQARVELQPDGAVLAHDLESPGGILLDGRKIQHHALSSGDALELCDYRLELMRG